MSQPWFWVECYQFPAFRFELKINTADLLRKIADSIITYHYSLEQEFISFYICIWICFPCQLRFHGDLQAMLPNLPVYQAPGAAALPWCFFSRTNLGRRAARRFSGTRPSIARVVSNGSSDLGGKLTGRLWRRILWFALLEEGWLSELFIPPLPVFVKDRESFGEPALMITGWDVSYVGTTPKSANDGIIVQPWISTWDYLRLQWIIWIMK